MLSDNANRATADVKSTVGKNNGKIAESGSVLFMYDRKGKIEVPAILDEEELLEAAIEAGCEDMELLEVSLVRCGCRCTLYIDGDALVVVSCVCCKLVALFLTFGGFP